MDIIPVMENGSYKVKLESEQYNIPIHYTLDGTEITPESSIYEEPFIVESSSIINAGLFVDGKLKEYFSQKEIVFHKAVGKNGYLKEPPSKRYPAHGAMSLIDGLKGSDNYRDGYWLGFHGTDMEFEVDLGDKQNINKVSASFFQNTGKWIFMPEKVQFELLDENKEIVAKETLDT